MDPLPGTPDSGEPSLTQAVRQGRGAGGVDPTPEPRTNTWPKQAHQSPRTLARVARKDSLGSRVIRTVGLRLLTTITKRA